VSSTDRSSLHLQNVLSCSYLSRAARARGPQARGSNLATILIVRCQANHKEAQCKEWSKCNASAYLHAPSLTNGGVCKPCAARQTAGDSRHSFQACKGSRESIALPPPLFSLIC